MLIFDIGYNNGNFTSAIREFYPESRIVGVDGDPRYAYFFQRNPPQQNIEFIHAVVSDVSNQQVSFYICESSPGINSINTSWISAIRHNAFFKRTSKEIKVVSVTLDDLIKIYGKPDIIKLDIEGAESMALAGLSQKCGLVLFEWCEEYYQDTIKCVDRLKALGYTEFANHVCRENDTPPLFLPDLKYGSWEEISGGYDIIPDRKLLWGMIYAR